MYLAFLKKFSLMVYRALRLESAHEVFVADSHDVDWSITHPLDQPKKTIAWPASFD